MTFRSIFTSTLTDKQIQKLFVTARYGKTISCSYCNSKHIRWCQGRTFRCKRCWSVFSITSNTWLSKSKLSLRSWYELLWCFALSLSAHKAGKLVHMHTKSCWHVYQTIRRALTETSLQEKQKITGTVEVDESFYGGLFKNLRKEARWKYRFQGKAKRGRGAKYRKQPVFGIYKRNGSVYLELITECTKQELETVIKRKIAKRSEVFSDTFTSYQGLIGLGYIHATVDHGMEIYVDGRIHVNPGWSLPSTLETMCITWE